MLKTAIFTVFLALFSFQAYACSFIPETFCKSIEIHSNYLIVAGEIIGIDEDGIDLEVIEVLRGEESKSVIRIWDGTDFDCNGPWDMSCETIGNLNDTVIISLPTITAIENSWDVVGDYRRPNPYSYISELKVSDGLVYGLIQGDAIAPDEFNILEIEYGKLQTSIIENEECKGLTSNVADLRVFDEIIITNPFISELEIRNISHQEVREVNIYSTLGEKVLQKTIDDASDLNIDLFNQASNMYVLQVVLESGNSRSFTIVKY